MSYCLPNGYVERLGAPQDFDANGGDTWQDEVYKTARGLADVLGLRAVLDFGCGSGFKLVKYFPPSSMFVPVGVDLPQAVERLNQTYPKQVWLTVQEIKTIHYDLDLVICSDVIEHVDEPDLLLSMLKGMAPKWLVISTPDRNLMAKSPRWTSRMGPPGNGCHVREWTFGEFRMYMDMHFDVVRHFHSNRAQATQCVIARTRPRY